MRGFAPTRFASGKGNVSWRKPKATRGRLAVLEYPYLYAAWHVCREDHARAVSERRPFSGARRSVDLYREKGTYGKAGLPYTVEEITGAPYPALAPHEAIPLHFAEACRRGGRGGGPHPDVVGLLRLCAGGARRPAAGARAGKEGRPRLGGRPLRQRHRGGDGAARPALRRGAALDDRRADDAGLGPGLLPHGAPR